MRMPDNPPTGSEINPYKWLEDWIDQAVAERRPAIEVGSALGRFAVPGTQDYLITPEMFGGELWFWPWNRAGFLYIGSNKPGDAAIIFTCAYLAALRVQHIGQYRIHKGMPLCNISYAHLLSGSPERAKVPALLAMAEDSL